MEEDCGHSYSDREFEELRDERDALANALREMLEAHDHGNSFSDEEVQDARALLEKMDTGTEPRPSSVE